jgi:hypothetical protein
MKAQAEVTFFYFVFICCLGSPINKNTTWTALHYGLTSNAIITANIFRWLAKLYHIYEMHQNI